MRTAGSSVSRSGAQLEMRLLLWDGGYFPIDLKFRIVGSIRTEGGELPSHFQVWAGSRQLLYSLQREKIVYLWFSHRSATSNSSITRMQLMDIIIRFEGTKDKNCIQHWNLCSGNEFVEICFLWQRIINHYLICKDIRLNGPFSFIVFYFFDQVNRRTLRHSCLFHNILNKQYIPGIWQTSY